MQQQLKVEEKTGSRIACKQRHTGTTESILPEKVEGLCTQCWEWFNASKDETCSCCGERAKIFFHSPLALLSDPEQVRQADLMSQSEAAGLNCA